MVNTPFHNLISYRSSDFPKKYANTVPKEHQSSSEIGGFGQRYFGEVIPVWRRKLEYPVWTRTTGKIRPVLVFESELNWQLENAARESGSKFANIDQINRGSFVSTSVKLVAGRHSSETTRYPAGFVFQEAADGPPRHWPRTPPELSHAKEKVFETLERARHMLSKQRVRDARELLRIGAASYPEDEQISKLLWAISPGRVSRAGTAVSDRSKEMAWIRENGHKYRGQWVAVKGSDLLACASNLKELLEIIKKKNTREDEPPLFQKIAPGII